MWYKCLYSCTVHAQDYRYYVVYMLGYYRDYRDKSLDYRDITFSIIAQH